MQFTPVSEVPTVVKKDNEELKQLFDGFLASDAQAAVIDTEGKKLPSVRSTLQNYVKRNKLNIKVATRQDNLYIERLPEGSDPVAENNAEDELANA